MTQVNPGLTGLEEWFPLDETSGNRIGIHSGWEMRDINTVLYGSGIKNNAADFEVSSNESLKDDTAAHFNVGDEDFSIILWHKPESQLSTRLLLARYYFSAGNYRQFYIGLNSSFSYHPTFVVSNDGSSFGRVSWPSALSNGTFYMIAAQHDSVNDKIRISIDAGAWEEADWSNGVFQTTSNRLEIGSYDGSASMADGLIDEVVLAKTLYSLDNLEWFYNGGAGRSYAELIASGLPRVKTYHTRRGINLLGRQGRRLVY